MCVAVCNRVSLCSCVAVARSRRVLVTNWDDPSGLRAMRREPSRRQARRLERLRIRSPSAKEGGQEYA
eukprot:scaffold272675_cov31-Tisochrysis_lutea.AAC.5